MIFDAIVGLIGALVEPIVLAGVYAVAGIANLFLIVLEIIVSLFIHGFKTKRVNAKGWKDRMSKLSGLSSIIVLAAIFLAVAVMEFMEKEIQLVSIDGHSLPFAEVVIRTETEERNERTDKIGNVDVPRFGLTSISIVDPRYVERTWMNEELENRLVVERTVFGSGVDKMVNLFFKNDE